MRTPFVSLEFPAEAAGRLAHLLPALSQEQAHDWTAQVYGYRNWHQLSFEVKSKQPPGLAAFDPDQRYVFDAGKVEALHGCSSAEANERRAYQQKRLEALLGWTEEAAEQLLREWQPLKGGTFFGRKLPPASKGTPVYRMLQRDIFARHEEGGAFAEFDYGGIYLGFPGTVSDQRRAAQAFLQELPHKVLGEQGTAFAADLELPSAWSTLRRVTGDTSFAQVRKMPFFAVERENDKIVAFAMVEFALHAYFDGTHCLKARIERLVYPGKDREVQLGLAYSISLALWDTVNRYLWCTVGNTDQEARVQVEHRNVPAEQACAKMACELLVDACGWPSTDDTPEAHGLHFETAVYA